MLSSNKCCTDDDDHRVALLNTKIQFLTRKLLASQMKSMQSTKSFPLGVCVHLYCVCKLIMKNKYMAAYIKGIRPQ